MQLVGGDIYEYEYIYFSKSKEIYSWKWKYFNIVKPALNRTRTYKKPVFGWKNP